MKRILAIKAGGIGDVLLALPTIQALRKGFRPCSLTLVCPSALHPLLKGVVDECTDINSRFIAQWMGPDPGREMATFFGEYDLIVSWFGYEDKEFQKNIELFAPGGSLFIPPHPPPRSHPDDFSLHVSDWHLGFLNRIGIPEEIILSPELKGMTLPSIKWTPDMSAPTFAVHPGSGAWYKNWPPERFAGLAKKFLEYDHRCRIALIQGPADAEAGESVLRLLPGERVQTIRTTSLLDLAMFLAGCTMYVGNDSGISHLAGAVGCPTIVFYGPTDPRVWRIRREDAMVVWNGLPCSPCSRDVATSCTHRRCLHDITVYDIWDSPKRHRKDLLRWLS